MSFLRRLKSLIGVFKCLFGMLVRGTMRNAFGFSCR
jgi:hypothetical protein